MASARGDYRLTLSKKERFGLLNSAQHTYIHCLLLGHVLHLHHTVCVRNMQLHAQLSAIRAVPRLYHYCCSSCYAIRFQEHIFEGSENAVTIIILTLEWQARIAMLTDNMCAWLHDQHIPVHLTGSRYVTRSVSPPETRLYYCLQVFVASVYLSCLLSLQQSLRPLKLKFADNRKSGLFAAAR